MEMQYAQRLPDLQARTARHVAVTQSGTFTVNKRPAVQKIALYCVLPSLLFFTTAAYAQFDIHRLERLFTNAKQRQQIDNQRHGRAHITHKRALHKITLSGYMQRSDGKNVVWVNGISTLNTNTIAGVRVEPGSINHKNQVTIRVNGRSIKLRPGESWRPSTRTASKH